MSAALFCAHVLIRTSLWAHWLISQDMKTCCSHADERWWGDGTMQKKKKKWLFRCGARFEAALLNLSVFPAEGDTRLCLPSRIASSKQLSSSRQTAVNCQWCLSYSKKGRSWHYKHEDFLEIIRETTAIQECFLFISRLWVQGGGDGRDHTAQVCFVLRSLSIEKHHTQIRKQQRVAGV